LRQTQICVVFGDLIWAVVYLYICVVFDDLIWTVVYLYICVVFDDMIWAFVYLYLCCLWWFDLSGRLSLYLCCLWWFNHQQGERWDPMNQYAPPHICVCRNQVSGFKSTHFVVFLVSCCLFCWYCYNCSQLLLSIAFYLTSFFIIQVHSPLYSVNSV
jgi:hypothetical protein